MLPGGVYDGRLFASPSIVAHLDKVGQIILQTSWFQAYRTSLRLVVSHLPIK